MIAPFFLPHWPVPAQVKAYSTLRYPGYSQFPYAEFNLALHVDDNKANVVRNRQELLRYTELPNEPKWLSQTHSNIALTAETISTEIIPVADASYTRKTNTICIIMT